MAVSVSLKKLAEILGLAPSTVSRALKGHPARLSERTDRSVHYTHKGGNGGEAVALY